MTLVAITYDLALVETNKKWVVELSTRAVEFVWGPQKKVLNYTIAIFFGPPMIQDGPHSAEISV